MENNFFFSVLLLFVSFFFGCLETQEIAFQFPFFSIIVKFSVKASPFLEDSLVRIRNHPKSSTSSLFSENIKHYVLIFLSVAQQTSQPIVNGPVLSSLEFIFKYRNLRLISLVLAFCFEELSTTGEKEWYFYCPRDRKYRNSARPNRVTGAGFWKATGTDRPIYSSDGTKCIGLKKSLVFYRGRAAKGIKTDWMMHEFRLPSLGEPSPPKKHLGKSLPANDAWAICRIFKKTNSMAHRALNHSWFSTLTDTLAPDVLTQGAHCTQFSSENISCTTEVGSYQTCSINDLQQGPAANFSALDVPSYRPINPTVYKPFLLSAPRADLSTNFMFSPVEVPGPTKSSIIPPSMPVNPDSTDSKGPQQPFNGFSISFTEDMQGIMCTGEDEAGLRKNQIEIHDANQWGTARSIGFPFSLPLPSNLPAAWKADLTWDSPPCPSEMSTTYSTNKCYT